MDKKWLETCLTAGEFLYGEYPVTVLQELYATKVEKISEEQIIEFCGSSSMMVYDGEMVTPMIVTTGPMLEMLRKADKEGNPYASLHFDPDELQVLLKERAHLKDQPYWIPNANQIEELMEKGYISSPAMTMLEEKIRSIGGNPEYLKGLWSQISTGKVEMLEAVNAVVKGVYPQEADLEEGKELRPKKDKIPTLEVVSSLMPLVQKFLNNVNIRSHKGWAPDELAKILPKHQGMPTIMPGSAAFVKTLREAEPQLRAMGANVDYSSIDSFTTIGQYGERRVVKVGRNDPCPCGSGKKYKNCHGR